MTCDDCCWWRQERGRRLSQTGFCHGWGPMAASRTLTAGPDLGWPETDTQDFCPQWKEHRGEQDVKSSVAADFPTVFDEIRGDRERPSGLNLREYDEDHNRPGGAY